MNPLLQLNNASLNPLRDRSEEPYAGTERSDIIKPHVGICEGAAR